MQYYNSHVAFGGNWVFVNDRTDFGRMFRIEIEATEGWKYRQVLILNPGIHVSLVDNVDSDAVSLIAEDVESFVEVVGIEARLVGLTALYFVGNALGNEMHSEYNLKKTPQTLGSSLKDHHDH